MQARREAQARQRAASRNGAAIKGCVKQWQYEPTYLNGVAVPVILTAKVHFLKTPIS